MNFDFSIGKINRPKVSITNYSIKFNKEAIELLGSPKHISIGLDKELKKLAFKASDEINYNEPVYNFALNSSRQNGLTISAKTIRNEVINLMIEKPKTKGIYFLLELDNDTKLGIIDLSYPIY